MIETIFIRFNDGVYDAPCDVAGVQLREIGSAATSPSAFVGMVAGQHVAVDAVAQAVIDPAQAWQWIADQGYERLPSGQM